MDQVCGVPYRALGRTGEKVSIVGLGGYHLGMTADEGEAIELIRVALDNGINYMDNAWGYHEGLSEIRMGKALRDGYRRKAFLTTKVAGQTKDLAKRQLEETLERFQVDHVELMQFHEIGRLDDADHIFGPGGAIEAALEARDAGLVRYIGFTGHGNPDAHLRMLDSAARYGFTFDTVLMALNVMDHHFGDFSFEKKVLPLAAQQGLGVLAIKSMGDSHVLRSNLVSPIECLHYSMSLPVSVVITGCQSMALLEQALEAARTFRPLSEEKVSALRERTAQAGSQGEFEPYKTTMTPDFHEWLGHPQWYRHQ